MKNIYTVLIIFGLLAGTLLAQKGEMRPTGGEKLKYFMVIGTLKPEVAKLLVENPVDPWPAAEKTFAEIPGAKLIDYYLAVGKARNYAIIAVPDSIDAAAITYQRMATGALLDIDVIEIIPASNVVPMLNKAKAINEASKK